MSLKSVFQINNINLQTILGLIDALPGNGKINISNLESTNSGIAGLKSSFLDNSVDLQKILDFVKALEFDSFSPVFSENSWADIIAACQNRSVPNTWKVGDSKAMTINGTDYQIDIIGKNHDTYGSSFAPLTFQIHDCYANGIKMYDRLDSPKNSWSESYMRNTYLPTVLESMPEEVKTAIKSVYKFTTEGNGSGDIQLTSDKLFLLSEVEVDGSIKYSGEGEGSVYEYYIDATATDRKKYINGAANGWWLRSPDIEDETKICSVSKGGSIGSSNYYDNGPATTGVSFAFCF